MDTRKLEIKYDDPPANKLKISEAKDGKMMMAIYDDAVVCIDRSDAIKIIEHLKREFGLA